jgi:hypothetical protein
MKIPLYAQSGEKTGEVTVSEKIFGHKVNKSLIHKILLLQLANKRHPIAHTLTKGEVRGGGKNHSSKSIQARPAKVRLQIHTTEVEVSPLVLAMSETLFSAHLKKNVEELSLGFSPRNLKMDSFPLWIITKQRNQRLNFSWKC